METNAKTKITVETTVNAPMEKVWDMFNSPEHITKWCAASEDWHTSKCETDFREGGHHYSRMEAKDGSFGFDFEWDFTKIKEHELVEYTLGDDRKVSVQYAQTDGGVQITQTFEAEDTNPVEMQRVGWQAILDNFKKYAEQ